MYIRVYVILVCWLYCNTNKGVSACMPWDDESKVSARLVSHQQCQTDSDCKENSFCYGNDNGVKGYCKCKDPYFTNKNRTYYECFLGANLGDSCIRDIQCQLNSGTASQCSSRNVCECKDEAHEAPDRKCYISKKLGDVCLTRNECRLNDGSFALCYPGHCVCPPLYHAASDLLHCIPSIELGQPCELDESCYHTNAFCDDVCKCSPNYAESRDGTKCLKVAEKFGDECTEDVQCARLLKESICTIELVCGCSSDYHEYIASEGTGCYRNTSIGEACDVKAECVLSSIMEDSVECSSGICTCTSSVSSNEYGCEIVNAGHSVFRSANLCFALLIVISTKLLLR